jgi:hypothetical protein
MTDATVGATSGRPTKAYERDRHRVRIRVHLGRPDLRAENDPQS